MKFLLAGIESLYGRPVWKRVLDPTSELVLVILTQNSADINAEKAFDALRRTYPSDPASAAVAGSEMEDYRPGWGGTGWARLPAPDWMAVVAAPLEELSDVIRPGGLANQEAPVIQASLARIREERGDHSLEFLGELEPLAARAWLTEVDGIGVKTASVVLMMSFGMALMPVDRHVGGGGIDDVSEATAKRRREARARASDTGVRLGRRSLTAPASAHGRIGCQIECRRA